jgi:hypothetical protein
MRGPTAAASGAHEDPLAPQARQLPRSLTAQPSIDITPLPKL